jgi:hypothetical protein
VDTDDAALIDAAPVQSVPAGTRVGNRLRRLPHPLFALLAAVLILVVAYPEVVFLGGSLSPVGLNGVVDRNARPASVQVYPNIPSKDAKTGLQDIGARAWQLVPATKFVHRSLNDNESISWNPYSAAGSLGPETVADLKLSPFVWLVAIFGASATAFTFVLLGFMVLALYCLQRFFVKTLGFGRMAGVAACLAFLFTGFGASDFNSSVGAPYILFPIVLYAITEYRRRGRAPRLLAAVAAYAGFILTTFVSVQLLMLVFVHAVAIATDASLTPRAAGESTPHRVANLLRRQLLVPLLALGVTAFAWLPILDALRHAGGDITSYGSRTLASSGKLRMLKILSPWLSDSKPWVGYIGIAPLVLIAAAWPRARRRERGILAVCIGLGAFGLVLHTSVPLIQRIGNLPGLRSIRGDYWAALVAAALTIGLGVAIAVISRRGASAAGAALVGGVLGLGMLGAWFGNFVLSWSVVPFLGVVAGIAVIAALVRIAHASRNASRRRLLVLACVALVAVELFSYQNHTRLKRFDVEQHMPGYVRYLQKHLGTDRVLSAGRGAIYPEWGSALGISQVETENVMQIPSYRTFFQQYVDRAENGLFLQIGANSNVRFAPVAAALSLLSVRYIVVDETLSRFDAAARKYYPLVYDDTAAGVHVYRNDAAFDNAFLSPALTTHRAPPGNYTRRSTQTDDHALLALAHNAGVPTTAAAGTRSGDAKVVDKTNTRVEIRIDAKTPAVLVLTDSYYRNWSVRINGRPAHLGRVDDIARGVVVPKGTATVTFQYRSPARSVGMLVSYLTVIGLALALLGGFLWRRLRRA